MDVDTGTGRNVPNQVGTRMTTSAFRREDFIRNQHGIVQRVLVLSDRCFQPTQHDRPTVLDTKIMVGRATLVVGHKGLSRPYGIISGFGDWSKGQQLNSNRSHVTSTKPRLKRRHGLIQHSNNGSGVLGWIGIHMFVSRYCGIPNMPIALRSMQFHGSQETTRLMNLTCRRRNGLEI